MKMTWNRSETSGQVSKEFKWHDYTVDWFDKDTFLWENRLQSDKTLKVGRNVLWNAGKTNIISTCVF